MKAFIKINLCLMVVCGAANLAVATERYVSLAGSNDAAGGFTNWAGAATQIQYAISACGSGDVVWVGAGTYEVGATVAAAVTNRVALTNAITLRSLNNDPTNTIIKGGVNIRPVYMVNNSTLIGFTLTNGSFATAVNGSGLMGPSNYAARAVVSNCLIAGNAALGVSSGGGVMNCTLYNCRIVANTAGHGGGAYGAVLRDCHIAGNTATDYGGGVNRCFVYGSTLVGNSAGLGGGGGYTPLASMGIMSNCTLDGNTSVSGGGVSLYELYACRLTGNSASNGGGAISATLYNCAIISNVSWNVGGGATGGRLFACILAGNTAVNRGGGGHSTGSLFLTNCLVTGNSAPDGGGVQGSAGVTYAYLHNCTISGNTGGWTGAGCRYATLWNCIDWGNSHADDNIATYYSCGVGNYFTNTALGNATNNPLFVAPADFHLQHESPCINAGTNQPWMANAMDLDGVSRIDRFTLRVDMGCYEYLSRGTIFGVR